MPSLVFIGSPAQNATISIKVTNKSETAMSLSFHPEQKIVPIDL